MNNFYGFAFSGTMIPNNGVTLKKVISPEEAKKLIESGEFAPCLNPSHVTTINLMKNKFGITMEIPKTAPKVSLKEPGDQLIVTQINGLPRLDASRHEYTEEEVSKAVFEFAIYTLLEIRS